MGWIRGLLAVLAGSPLAACVASPDTPMTQTTPVPLASPSQPSDKPSSPALSEAERERTEQATQSLRNTLRALSQEARFLLGHEDSTAYGVGWSQDPDRSDVKSLCGSHPAVHGWDLFRLEIGQPENGDGVNFELMRTRIRQAHQRGGINTISWHVDNPVSGGNAWDNSTRAVEHIVPGGAHHRRYIDYLDRVADFLESCRGDSGELIPIIFRPFHEHTGSWFWWGARHATDADYVKLWRFTVDHLRTTRGLKQLLFAFSPGGGDVDSEADYLFRYPGDDYVDVMGIDIYYDDDVASLLEPIQIMVRVAEKHDKPAALTEFGVRDGLTESTPPNWFREYFFEPLANDPTASRIAYALAWRNASLEHFFLPYPGHHTAADFAKVCADERLLLEEDLPLE